MVEDSNSPIHKGFAGIGCIEYTWWRGTRRAQHPKQGLWEPSQDKQDNYTFYHPEILEEVRTMVSYHSKSLNTLHCKMDILATRINNIHLFNMSNWPKEPKPPKWHYNDSTEEFDNDVAEKVEDNNE
ncbi:hypothetical protein ACH5RR_025788 [Cinchona calisaya]|uniref:Uncharacterized protein n=1 Tax=Cinchona calisaya TaxID=153742 RepID=A0ABD2Z2K7_9GENT